MSSELDVIRLVYEGVDLVIEVLVAGLNVIRNSFQHAAEVVQEGICVLCLVCSMISFVIYKLDRIPYKYKFQSFF
jgi:uncharacterized membrane protein YcfT